MQQPFTTVDGKFKPTYDGQVITGDLTPYGCIADYGAEYPRETPLALYGMTGHCFGFPFSGSSCRNIKTMW